MRGGHRCQHSLVPFPAMLFKVLMTLLIGGTTQGHCPHHTHYMGNKAHTPWKRLTLVRSLLEPHETGLILCSPQAEGSVSSVWKDHPSQDAPGILSLHLNGRKDVTYMCLGNC